MRFSALIFTLLLSGSAHAEMAPLDAHASSLTFTGHAFLHDFDGQAGDFEGGARIDPADPNLVTEAFIDIAAGRMTTREATRDRNMRAWLNSETDPRIEFHLTKVECLSGDPAKASAEKPAPFAVAGEFTLNHTTRPLTARVFGWRDGQTLVITGKTKIDTTSYGLPIIRQLFMTVDRNVDVSFRLVFDLPARAAN